MRLGNITAFWQHYATWFTAAVLGSLRFPPLPNALCTAYLLCCSVVFCQMNVGTCPTSPCSPQQPVGADHAFRTDIPVTDLWSPPGR